MYLEFLILACTIYILAPNSTLTFWLKCYVNLLLNYVIHKDT